MRRATPPPEAPPFDESISELTDCLNRSLSVVPLTAVCLRDRCSQTALGPVAGLAARGGSLVAGFNGGVIRFYSLPQRRLWMEVQAHSRLLSCLAVHPWRPMFATAAEDATVHVWELPEPGEQTQALLSGAWVDQLVTGLTFCGEGSDILLAAAYDCDDLRIWLPAPKAAGQTAAAAIIEGPPANKLLLMSG